VPAFGSEWYPRSMYGQGSPEYEHHREVCGDHESFGYKGLIDRTRAVQAPYPAAHVRSGYRPSSPSCRSGDDDVPEPACLRRSRRPRHARVQDKSADTCLGRDASLRAQSVRGSHSASSGPPSGDGGVVMTGGPDRRDGAVHHRGRLAPCLDDSLRQCGADGEAQLGSLAARPGREASCADGLQKSLAAGPRAGLRAAGSKRRPAGPVPLPGAGGGRSRTSMCAR
jgi:hypothetical protein